MNAKDIIGVFCSRGRRKFLPLVTSEVARKAGTDQDTVRMVLWDLTQQGVVKHSLTGHKIAIWELTPKGEKAARTLMQAAEVERSA